MKRIIKISFFTLILVLATTGCGGTKIQNVPAQSIIVKLSKADVFKSIYRAGMIKGWDMYKMSDGLVEATYSKKNYSVVINIKYSANSYGIYYKSSRGLKYNEDTQTIHKNYNVWIDRLKRQINMELTLAEM